MSDSSDKQAVKKVDCGQHPVEKRPLLYRNATEVEMPVGELGKITIR